MAALAGTSRSANGGYAVTKISMGASDTFTFVPGTAQILHLHNTTASPVVITMVGTAPVAITPVGAIAIGGSVATSAGYAITVPTSGIEAINLDTIAPYLQGTLVVTATNGTGVDASLINA